MQPLHPDESGAVGPYRPLAELGRGGMGRVLLASGGDGELVALKLVLPHLLTDDEFHYRFRREVLTSREAASGPYTAAVVAADEESAQPWLASEFFYGPTLAEALESQGPLDERAVLLLAQGLVAALAQIHGIEVLHRDIKPSNVLLTEDGVRLIDFGIARAPGSSGDYTLTTTGAMIGAPPFMSPEQITGGELTPKSDMFSLGTTLLTAYTGANPFDTGNQFQTLNQVVNTEPDLSAVPDSLRRIIEPCLRKDPDQRPTAADLARQIGAVPPGGVLWPPGVRYLDQRQRDEITALVGRLGYATTVRQSDKRVVMFAPGVVPGQTPTTPYPPGAAGMPPGGQTSSQWDGLKLPAGIALGLVLMFALVFALDAGADEDDPDSDATTDFSIDDTDGDTIGGGEDTAEDYEPPDPIADAQIGDCFHDHGTETVPDLEPASYCDNGTFEVVDIYYDTTELTSCDATDRVTTSVSDSANDMVLCLSYIYDEGDAYHAQPGECVYGPNDDYSPWYIIDCEAWSFEVLERIPGTTDESRCTDSRYYNHTLWYTTSETYLDVVLCLSFVYPDDSGYAELNDCLHMTGTPEDANFEFADCDSANVYVTGRTNESMASDFCGYDAWWSWQSDDFPEHGFTMCWRYL